MCGKPSPSPARFTAFIRKGGKIITVNSAQWKSASVARRPISHNSSSRPKQAKKSSLLALASRWSDWYRCMLRPARSSRRARSRAACGFRKTSSTPTPRWNGSSTRVIALSGRRDASNRFVHRALLRSLRRRGVESHIAAVYQRGPRIHKHRIRREKIRLEVLLEQSRRRVENLEQHLQPKVD